MPSAGSWKNEIGLSLIALILVILVLGTIGIIFSRLMSSHQETIPLVLDTSRAFYAAQGGVEYVGKYLKVNGGNDWTHVPPIPNQPVRLGPAATFSVTFTPVDRDHLTATIIGSSGAARRQITANFEKTSGSVMAVRSRGLIQMGNHAVLDCDPLNPSNPVCTQGNLGSCPCVRQHVAPADLPSFSLPVPAPPTLPGGCTIQANRTINGGTYSCPSGLTLQNNVRVDLNGPVTIFTTTFVLGNNARLNPMGSAADLLIMAQGNVILWNNSQMKGAIYAPGYNVIVQNNASFTGTIAGGGTVALDNNSAFDVAAGSHSSYYHQTGGGSAVLVSVTEWQE